MSKNIEHTQAKQQWLAQRLKNFNTKPSSSGITPQSRPPHLPLSFAQQRLWFLDQWEPGSTAYLLSYAWRLQGPLDAAALEASFTTLVTRHEGLRTTFAMVDGHPVQVITPVAPVSLPLRDLTALSEEARDAELTRWLEEEPHRPFDLATGPLWRGQLLRVGPEEHVLLLTIHHIITDGWSMGILFKELSTLYTAQVTGQPTTLPPLPLQYADFAIWQRQWLQGDMLDRQLTYWRTQLAEAPPYLELPTDSPRPSQQTYRGDRISFTLPPSLTQELKRLSQQEGVTLFMTLLAAFQGLLARYTSQRDILVGTPIAGRTHTELEGLIGFFVNTMVLRTQFKGQPTFRDLLQQVRDTCLDAYSHQDLPFEKLVEALQPVRDPSRHPLIQTMFQVHQADSTALFTLLGLETTPIPATSSMAKFDLHLALTSRRDTLTGSVVFNTDLFAPATMARFTKHFQALLAAVVENPAQAVSQISLLTAPEQHELLVEWNPSVVSEPPAICVHQLFEAQAARTPEAMAVVCADEQLTYAQLNQQATQLANYLRRQGIGPDVRVGVCLERGLDLVISLLGILKAGGAYVPLDPAAPLARLRFMLEDAEVALVLTSAALQGRLAACLKPLGPTSGEGPPVMALDMEWPDWGHAGLPPSCPEVHTENLAYVMYTSGSTGQPKGVEIPHRGVVRLVKDPTYLQGPSQIVCLQLASPAFDAATFEIWACLINGGKLILGPPSLPSLSELGALLQRHQITILWLTAGLFHQMVDWDLQALGTVQRLLAGGDVLSPFHVRRVVEQLPNCQLLNGYGPTENTTFTCCFPIPLAGDFGNSVPIGRPIAHTQVYVLDAQQQLVARGVAGELCISGLGLARGYQGNPDLTAEKFIPHPFSPVLGARLYRSGDIARYRPDGTIEFQGRRDNQIKLRGYRIELGEIETALSQHPQVHEAVVLCREDRPGKKQLVAYITKAQNTLELPTLRTTLQALLPGYMVPSAFVLLERLPLTPNGKVNRLVLPPPEGTRGQLARAYVAPRTLIEEMLVTIWQDVLGLDQIGVHDNFFELGGHSLLATQMVARVRALLQMDISLRTLFEHPTIAGLGSTLQAARTKAFAPPGPCLHPIQSPGPIPLSFAQQRLWFLDQWEPGSTAYLLSYAWRLQGPLDAAALEASFTTLVTRHEGLRTTFAMVDGHPVQVITPVAPVSLPLRDLTALSEEARDAELTRWLEEEPHRPFDLATGPLWRGQLLRVGPEEHVLLLTIHHIITDGWSMGILFKELSTLYTAQVTGQPTTLPPLPLQYADFAIWQRQWLQGDMLDRQLTYWRTQLAEAPPYLELPTDSPRPSQQTYRGDRISFTLPPSLTQELKRLSQQEGVTLFMTLLAAFQGLLARYTSQRDILVGTPIAGRTHTELEGLIGFFVNTMVLRTQFKGQPTFRDLLQQVRDTCLDAYSHQDLPFEKLVEALQPVRDPSRHPLIQTMFQVHQADSTALFTLLGLETTPIPATSSMAKFDLHLALTSRRDTLTGSVVFNTDLFAPATMARFTKHFQALLAAVVENPAQAVSQISLLTAPEQHELLVEWNPSVVSEPPAICVHQLFEAQAARTPEAMAVVCADEQLTYAQLNQQATQLANYLRRQGIGPDVRVGVCLERGLDLVISLLGILKAGGAYVPLDPAAPLARLRFMLEDAEVALVLTSAALQGRLAACLKPLGPTSGEGPPVMALDMEWPDWGHAGLPPSCPEVHTENLAYVMYTSGSTGQPKGVEIPHRGVVRLVNETNYVKITSEDRVGQLANAAFDALTFEVWGPLVRGSAIVVFSQEEVLVPTTCAIQLRQHGITVIFLTTALFNQMAREVPSGFTTLGTVLFGGEQVDRQWVEAVFKVGPPSRLLHVYGPTESTTFATWHQVKAEDLQGRTVPIGRPLANTQGYLLDAQQQLVARGVGGELYIGGLGLARGYHRHPGLTAEKFIPHPFSPVLGARLYRSGDIARYRPDGTIEFQGRRDNQIKLRGYRIELGEIETILTTHPAVREVVVLPREDNVGNKRLVAYIVPESESTPNISEFRDFLSRTLPSYMIPAGFVFLEAFPLTSNGKINRRMLPVEDQRSSQEEGTYVAARNSLESQLTKIWETVLGRQPIGVTDNFFNMGGESLMAVRLCSEMERTIQKKIPVSLIFHAQTIEQLAKKMGQREENEPLPLMVPIQASGSNPPIFCALLGAPFMPFMKNYPNQPLYTFFNQGHDGRPALHTTVEKIANWYLKEMRTVQPKGPYYLAGYSFGGMVVYEMAQQLRKQGETIGLLALVDPTTGRPQPAPSSSWVTQVGQLLTPSPQVSKQRSTYFTIVSTVIFPRAFGAIQWRLKNLKNLSTVTIKRMICKIFFGLDYPLPTSLRPFYRTRVVQQAARQYSPQYYPGQIVIFQTKKNVEHYWGKLCAEVLQVYDFPTGHLDLVDGPHTQTLLHELMSCLEKAQKNRE